MIQSDVIGVLFVYGYVAFLLLITEKVISKKYPLVSRKILHILTGNIAFILPIFVTREIMAFVAAGPFIFFTYLMSPFSPIKSMRGKTSEVGHGLGLVYYAITWTILAYLFFDQKVIIAIGILSMSYGDGLASVLGVKYGQRTYRLFEEVKSYVGSMTMFFCTLMVIIIAMIYYGTFEGSVNTLAAIVGIAGIAAFIEGATPKGLDDLSVPFLSALLYWLLLGV